MRPRRGDPPLTVVTQEGMTVEDLESLIRKTKYNGFPVVTNNNSQRLVGYLYKKDLAIAIGKLDIEFLVLIKWCD